jgi:anti-sigma regulatory factor (Ser/Thr protein kinase)
MTSRRTVRTDLAPGPSAPARAREFLTRTCRRWRAEGFVADAALVVSELVTNAVRHAGTEMELTLELAEGTLTIRVRDHGPGMPRLIPPAERGFGGQGLAIVARLAQAWGVVVEDGGGKAVWCRLGPHTAVPAGAGTQGSVWKGDQDIWSA